MVNNMENKETLRHYLTYNKDTSEIEQIFYSLSVQLKIIHSKGYCVDKLNSDSILLEKNKNYSSTNQSLFSFSSISESHEPEKDFSKNITDLSKLAIGAFITAENGFCDYSSLETKYIKSYFDEMSNYISNSEYYRSVIMDNDTSMYYSDFVNQKNNGGKKNARQIIKANAYGKMYVPDEESAFIKIVVYPVLIIVVIMIIAMVSQFF